MRQDVYLGSVISLPLGDGRAGEPAQVSLSVVDAHDSIEGFLGIRSFAVLKADDLQAEVIAHRSAAEALRQELDFMTGTRSSQKARGSRWSCILKPCTTTGSGRRYGRRHGDR